MLKERELLGIPQNSPVFSAIEGEPTKLHERPPRRGGSSFPNPSPRTKNPISQKPNFEIPRW
jgi:hypothetical protein